MNDDDLDNMLRALSTPEAQPDFWAEIDQAIADQLGDEHVGSRASGSTLGAVDADRFGSQLGPNSEGNDDISIEADDEKDNVLDFTRSRPVPTRSWSERYGRHILTVAASVAILAGVFWLAGTRSNSVAVEPADPPTTQAIPTDLLDAEMVGAALAESYPNATLNVEPVLEDINEDGTNDAAVVTTIEGELAVITVDGTNRQVSQPLIIPGEDLVTFTVRPGRLTVTTADDFQELTTELVLLDDSPLRLSVDQQTPRLISDWNITIAGIGELGLSPERCESGENFEFAGQTAAGTFVNITSDESGVFLFVDGPEGSWEGSVTIHQLTPFEADGEFTAADDSAVGAATQVSITGPGC